MSGGVEEGVGCQSALCLQKNMNMGSLPYLLSIGSQPKCYTEIIREHKLETTTSVLVPGRQVY